MRALIRLPEPNIITRRGANWLATLLASGKLSPDSSKYRNPAILLQLNGTSHYKCFYCESRLKELPSEIDHHIESAIEINLSYVWTNLYLSCDSCNNKLDHNRIPINQALDPCVNTDEEISEHLSFDDECIIANNNSQLGLNTIQKYRLDSAVLDKRRASQLKNFHKVLLAIKDNQISDGRRVINDDERRIINRFTQADQPYTLMFKVILNGML